MAVDDFAYDRAPLFHYTTCSLNGFNSRAMDKGIYISQYEHLVWNLLLLAYLPDSILNKDLVQGTVICLKWNTNSGI